MPKIKIRDTEIYYIDTGVVSSNETIVFAHGLLWDHEMFLPQIEFLKKRYRCIAFDFRGQGKSLATNEGYDMDNLTEDTLVLLQQLVDQPVHFLGLSMGGFIGMRLAIHHSDKLKSLILLETTADPEPEENKPKYLKLVFFAKWFSISLVVKKVMAIMFSQSFLNDPDKDALKRVWAKRLYLLNRRTFGRAVEGVVHREGIYQQLNQINVPTLIMVGDEDVATVPAKSYRLQKAIEGSQLKIINAAGHTSSIEQPETVNRELDIFLSSLCAHST
jgi:3-oxoadipate enol-lactonase